MQTLVINILPKNRRIILVAAAVVSMLSLVAISQTAHAAPVVKTIGGKVAGAGSGGSTPTTPPTVPKP